MKDGKPKSGETLTLAFDFWKGEQAVKGSKAIVIKSRRDRRCVSKLRIFVKLEGGENTESLDARWFQEYGSNYNFVK